MKILTFALTTFMASASLAAEKFNHITCEYQRSASGWEFMAVDYNRDGFELEKGQSAAIVSAWTSTRDKNLGYCITLRGTSTPNTVETVLYVFEGDEIFGVDLKTCEPSGSNISIVKQETQIARRGDSVEMSVDNWWDQGEPLLFVKHYIPQESENEKVTEIAASKCADLKPAQ